MELKDCKSGMRVKVARPPKGKPHLAGWKGRIETVPRKPKNGVWLVEVRFISGADLIDPDCLEVMNHPGA